MSTNHYKLINKYMLWI